MALSMLFYWKGHRIRERGYRVREVSSHRDDEATMLLCEGKGCGAAWHMGCLPEPLDQIPEGDWYCPDCE